MNYDISNLAPDDDNYPDESLDEIVFGCSKPKPAPCQPTVPNAIAVIGVSANSIRVVLNAERIIYAGKWKLVPDWMDIKGRDKAYVAEFKLLAMHMRLQQCGVNDVRVFENVKVA